MSFLDEVREMDSNSSERLKRIERQIYLREAEYTFDHDEIRKLVLERCEGHSSKSKRKEVSEPRSEYIDSDVKFSIDPDYICGCPIQIPDTIDLPGMVTKRQSNNTFKKLMQQHMERLGITSSEVYQNAQVLKQTFSKLMTTDDYKLSKDTAVQICLALHLPIEEAEIMLKSAGFYLSESNKRDVMFRILFEEGYYNITDINIALMEMGLKTFGRTDGI